MHFSSSASLASLPDGVWNICTGQGTSVKNYCRIVAKLLGKSEELLKFGAIGVRPDEIPYLVGAPEWTKQQIGWHAKLDLEDGLRQTLIAMDVIGGQGYIYNN